MIFKKPAGPKVSDTSRLALDVPNDVLQKLEQIARYQSTWDASAPRVEVEDVVRKALNEYLRERVSDAGVVLPDVRATALDAPSAQGPIVRVANAVLVHAIDNGILDFQVPPSDDSATDGQIASLFPEHIRPWCIRRLQVMTTPKTGTIPIVHEGTPYTVYVEFDTMPDGRARVHVKLNRL